MSRVQEGIASPGCGMRLEMDQKDIEGIVRQNVGKKMRVTFGDHRETVLIVSADPDGFICRIVAPRPGDAASEFWIAYAEVAALTAPEADPA